MIDGSLLPNAVRQRLANAINSFPNKLVSASRIEPSGFHAILIIRTGIFICTNKFTSPREYKNRHIKLPSMYSSTSYVSIISHNASIAKTFASNDGDTMTAATIRW